MSGLSTRKDLFTPDYAFPDSVHKEWSTSVGVMTPISNDIRLTIEAEYNAEDKRWYFVTQSGAATFGHDGVGEQYHNERGAS